jgi:hypothetical protein
MTDVTVGDPSRVFYGILDISGSLHPGQNAKSICAFSRPLVSDSFARPLYGDVCPSDAQYELMPAIRASLYLAWQKVTAVRLLTTTLLVLPVGITGYFINPDGI